MTTPVLSLALVSGACRPARLALAPLLQGLSEAIRWRGDSEGQFRRRRWLGCRYRGGVERW